MINFTVAIPTYNGEHRLPEVLDALCSQTGTDQLFWEIIVVDNNSSDRTRDVVQTYQTRSTLPIRYCLETRQGAAYARARGVREAQGNLIGFLDDDNVPTPTWVAAAVAFAESHPDAGAYGSRVYGDYEIEPPPNFKRIAPFLAITQRGSRPLLYDPTRNILPPSAGLVVRKQVWLDYVPVHPILVGRLEGNPLAGEDLEMISYIHRSSWEIWYNPAMEIWHKIPRHRLERSYLVPLFRGMGLSRHITRMLNTPRWQRPFACVAYFLNDLRKVLGYWLKYRTAHPTDVVLACELQFCWSSLISPFYLWKHGYLKPRTSQPVAQKDTNPAPS